MVKELGCVIEADLTLLRHLENTFMRNPTKGGKRTEFEIWEVDCRNQEIVSSGYTFLKDVRI